MYFQLLFALDRVKALAPQHPEWKTKEPFASLLKGDVKAALAGGEHAMLEIVMATHAGMTTEEFEQIVKDWIATAKHPKFKRPYTEWFISRCSNCSPTCARTASRPSSSPAAASSSCARGRRRSMASRPNRSSAAASRRSMRCATASRCSCGCRRSISSTTRPASPSASTQHIGRRPIAAFGNSDGDQQMLEWTQAGSGARLMMLVHHDDAAREFAYGAESKIGTFSDALMAEAKKKAGRSSA